MRNLPYEALDLVAGGDEAPTCRVVTDGNNSSTVCSCPTGTEITVGTSDNKTVVTCKTVEDTN